MTAHRVIDAHAHVWPERIARVVLARKPAGLAPVADGTVSGLLRCMDASAIDMSCALAIAVEARHVRTTNAFIGAVPRDRLIPFGTVHTGLSIEDNLKSLADNGIRAVKFHPNFQGLSLADPAVRDLFTALAEHRIVVLTHAGAGEDAGAHERGSPRHLVDLAKAVPGLTLIGCHFGGYHRLEEAAHVIGSRVVLETSWPPRLAALGRDRVAGIIRRHGTDRVVFGSDWPMADSAAEADTVRGLGLSEDEQAAVLAGNLARLLGIG